MKTFNQFKEDYEKRGQAALRNIGNNTIDYFAGGGDLKGFGDVLNMFIGKGEELLNKGSAKLKDIKKKVN